MDLVSRRPTGRSALSAFPGAANDRAQGPAEATACPSSGLAVWGETVRAATLARQNVFRRTDAVVFRAEVARAGRVCRDARVSVEVLRGPLLAMTYEGRARRGAPHYRSAPWQLALDQPAGRLVYTITATDPASGASARWSPLPTARAALTILPCPYSVRVEAAPTAHAVRVTATVTRPIARDGGRVEDVPMAVGGVTAAIGAETGLSSGASVGVLRRARLQHDAASGAWTGLIATAGLRPGVYVVQVCAHDLVPTPNAGVGHSYPFRLARGA